MLQGELHRAYCAAALEASASDEGCLPRLLAKTDAPLLYLTELAVEKGAVVAGVVHSLKPLVRWIIQWLMDVLVRRQTETTKVLVQVGEFPHWKSVRARPWA